MIRTLPVTILLEGLVSLLYALRTGKPVWPILATGFLANLLTQSLLWLALQVWFRYYLTTLLLAEALIWLVEALALWAVRSNRLTLRAALFLSLALNLSSFTVGWFLPL